MSSTYEPDVTTKDPRYVTNTAPRTSRSTVSTKSTVKTFCDDCGRKKAPEEQGWLPIRFMHIDIDLCTTCKTKLPSEQAPRNERMNRLAELSRVARKNTRVVHTE